MLVYLHRRHVRKERLEDKNDPHKSLDFGMEGVGKESKWAKQKKGPEMTVTDVNGATSKRTDRGLSMDELGLGNPYLLPQEVNGSGSSIHSMSRSFQDDHDPYRPVTFIKGDGESTRSRAYNEKGSIYSGATSIHSANEKAGLVANASRMSRSFPKRGDSKLSGEPLSPQDSIDSDTSLAQQMHSQNAGAPNQPTLPNISESSPRINVHSPPPPPEKEAEFSPPPRTTSAAVESSGPAARKGPLPHIAIPPRMSTQSSDYGDIEVDEIDDVPPPVQQRRVPSLMVEEPDRQKQRLSVQGLNLADSAMPTNRLSVMGLRPLPPSGPEDNPETRANRIRSFYKEYFDDSKPEPAGAQYQDTYDLDYLTDAAIYDPDSGGFVTAGRAANRPFAEPLGRRAMTPPPRGARTPVPGPHRRQMSTQTVGRYGPRGPMPKKPLPPPMPLKSLPTPHMLKDDTAIFNADDFAPPVSYRDRQAGRGTDSPTGSLRPYSPSVASHVPLADSMADLSPMPSPYMMRKSGTYTALDFAPPSRIGGGEGMSDAGSIRSARSGISRMHNDALRAGAYRVSRLPPEMVGTRDDLAAQLKPSWDMRKDRTIG